MDLKTLREKRGTVYAESRALLDKAKAEKRDLNDEENAKYDSLIQEYHTLKAQIEREERQQEIDREMAASAADEEARRQATNPATAQAKEREARARQFNEFIVNGGDKRSFDINISTIDEFRAMQVDSDTAGGYLVSPEQFVAMLVKDIDNNVYVRQQGTVIPVPSATSLGVPTLTDPSNASWTAEIESAPEDSTMAFGKRKLYPHALSKLIKVSNPLLQKALLSPEALVRERFAYVFGITEETAFMTGNGAEQPLGLFTASSDGISTSRDVSTHNSTTAIAADNLIACKYTLKTGYWARASWIFHRDAMAQISKLKDGDGQYLWRPGLQADEPDRLLGRPVNVSEYAPNTFTTGLYVGLLGDLSYYWIADSMSMTLQRLVELYAATNQTGFIGRMEVDGMPVLENAFVRVKLG